MLSDTDIFSTGTGVFPPDILTSKNVFVRLNQMQHNLTCHGLYGILPSGPHSSSPSLGHDFSSAASNLQIRRTQKSIAYSIYLMELVIKTASKKHYSVQSTSEKAECCNQSITVILLRSEAYCWPACPC